MTIKRKIYDEKLIAGDLDVTVDEVFGDSDGYFIKELRKTTSFRAVI